MSPRQNLISRARAAARAAWRAFAESYEPFERDSDRAPDRPPTGLLRRPSHFGDASGGALTPERLGEAIRQADDGDLSAQAEIFETIEQDGRILAVLRKRKRAVLKRRMVLGMPKGSDESRATRSMELAEQAFRTIRDLPDALFNALDAVGKGFSCLDIGWDDVGGGIFAARRLRWWPQRCFTVDRDDHDVLRVLTDQERTSGELLVPSRWIVHRSYAMSSSLGRASLARALAWQYAFKHWGVAEWLIMAERWANPTALGKYNPSTDEKERTAVLSAVQDLPSAGGAVIPTGASLELLEAAAADGSAFEKLVSLCNTEIAITVLGVTLTTEQGDKGARSLGEVHHDDQEDLIDADADALGRTLTEQYVAPVILFNLGPDYPVPEVS